MPSPSARRRAGGSPQSALPLQQVRRHALAVHFRVLEILAALEGGARQVEGRSELGVFEVGQAAEAGFLEGCFAGEFGVLEISAAVEHHRTEHGAGGKLGVLEIGLLR